MALTLEQVAGEADYGSATGEQLTRLLLAGEALVDHIAPNAPTAIRDQATAMIVAWLVDRPAGGVLETMRGESRWQLYRPMMVSAIRGSGAGALLLPWREHDGYNVDRAGEEV